MDSPPRNRRVIFERQDRIKSYNHLHSFLISLTKEDICSLGKVLKNPVQFSESTAFRIRIDPSLGMAAKIMKNTETNRREIEWYHQFMDNVLSNGVPHFPLVSRTEQCDVCSVTKTYNNIDWFTTVVEKNCIILFSELADGDLKGTIASMKKKEEQIISMICQILMALLVLEKKGVVHNDLHLGNVLVHNEPEERANDGLFMHYRLGDQDLYIKHAGQLWVLWDFGMMVKNGGMDPRGDGIVVDTFTNDWKSVFLPLLKRHLSSSQFIRDLSIITDSSTSILDVIKRLSNVISSIGDIGDRDIMNKLPFIV